MCVTCVTCRHKYGNLVPRNHAGCSLFASAHQPPDLRTPLRVPVLLLDATLNLQVHVCGIPGCRGLLQKGEAPAGRQLRLCNLSAAFTCNKAHARD
jgi:hypothetical protein